MYKTTVAAVTLLAAVSLTNTAQAVELGKPIKASVMITHPHLNSLTGPAKKDIVLMNIKLSSSQRQALLNYQPKAEPVINHKLPSAVDLGMNNVPVLDQGMHGSCVTFATAAALDAVLGKGDYISELCQLELGTYLEERGYDPSGWEGSFGPVVLDQMTRFGVVSRENQKMKSCAGNKEYPVTEMQQTGNPMSLDEFKSMSEDINERIYPIYLMNFKQRIDTNGADADQAAQVLTEVKQSLSEGNRLTFGTFLVLVPSCNVGACATYHAKMDTWALTKEIEQDSGDMAGHEMVIIGYDDNAVAVDQEGIQYRGLLTLRNSWGENVGDKGNFYMTYDFFKKYAVEVQKIVPQK